MTLPPTFQGFGHGHRLTRAEAVRLFSSPDFAPAWAIVPGPNGHGLTLMLRARCTAADLDRAQTWARKTARRTLPTPYRGEK